MQLWHDLAFFPPPKTVQTPLVVATGSGKRGVRQLRLWGSFTDCGRPPIVGLIQSVWPCLMLFRKIVDIQQDNAKADQ